MQADMIQSIAPITGINPFNELAVDAEIWRQAHDYHARHQQLHATASHRPGIVYGLEVVAASGKQCCVVVAPGVAVDPAGHTVVLEKPVELAVDEKGQLYVTLALKRAFIDESETTVGSGVQYYQFVEGREVLCTREAGPEAIELARIYRTAKDQAVKDAENPLDPGSDEINVLHRDRAFPYCHADAVVGELPYVPKPAKQGASPARASWKPNRAGMWNLLQEGNGKGLHLSFAGPTDLNSDSLPTLVYVAGQHGFQPFTSEQVESLRTFLQKGGTLFGESCGDGGFKEAFAALSEQIGAKLTQVAAGHPLLGAFHVFSAPPPGAVDKGAVLADDSVGIVFSERNYGGAWQGQVARPQEADARERIRQAVEFGLNVIVHAARRMRQSQISALI